MLGDRANLGVAHHIFWYQQPATRRAEAPPLGNGRIGAMVYGGTEKETVFFTEATCWSG